MVKGSSGANNTDRHRRHRSVRFFIVLFCVFLAFAIAYLKFRRSAILTPFLALNARVASYVLNLFGASADADGATLVVAGSSFQVITECTSIIPTAIYVSAVMAWHSTTREKLIGLTIGVVALFFVNVLRIISLCYAASAYPEQLHVFHIFVWPAVLIVLTVGLWLLWAERLVRTPTEKPG